MNRPAASVMLMLAACGLHGCVAAVVPLAAAGIIGKKHVIDPAKRAKQAQAGMMPRSVLVGPEETPIQPGLAVEAEADTTPAPAAIALDTTHPYAAMVDYALERATARAAGDDIRSAVLVEGVSLVKPLAVPCAEKQLAVIIDVDTAPGAGPLTQSGLATLLDRLRSADIRIAWMGQGSIAEIEEMLTRPNVAEYSLLSQRDDILSAPTKGPRKQEQRWAFAKGHCVLAAAGDQQSDFDELFDYLQDPSYAAPLETFNDRGWFLTPSPLRVNVENTP